MTTHEFSAPVTYVTRDGITYAGDTAFQVVDAMRADSTFTEHKELDAYMEAAAKRFAHYENVTVRFDSPENFLADLVSAGVLSKG